MLRVTRDTDATISSTWDDSPSAVTIGIVDLLGDLITASATEPTVDREDGVFDYPFAAGTDVAFRQATWNGGTEKQHDTIEVVGAHLFMQGAARAFKNGALSDAAKYSTASIFADRDRITDDLETVTGRSWIQRYRMMAFRGSGTPNLRLADYVRSLGGGPGDGALRDTIRILSAADQNGEIPASSVVIADAGLLVRTDGIWRKPDQGSPVNIWLEIEYGVEDGYQSGAGRTAQEILVERLRHSNIPDRAISWTDEFGNVRLDTMPTEARDWIKTHDYRTRVY